MVLLKYGEIMAQFDRNSIYIPIWYYLNDGQTVDEIFDSELIYIPIWYYLNLVVGQLSFKSFLFTFQYGTT